MITVWKNVGNTYSQSEDSLTVKKLPVGVYTISEDIFKNLHLHHTSDQFTINHKVYGFDDTFIKRVNVAWNASKDNLGVLLSGVKGGGKSITAKMICNQTNLPVILVERNHDNLTSFLSQIQQDVVVFIDEYEKIYEESNELLSLMDGIHKSQFRKLFLLTTNEMYISKYLLQRPSRIRYVKKYANLSKEMIEEIIDDLLINKEFREDAIETISDLELITIDLVISIVNEINIHNQKASEFIDIFNAHPQFSNKDSNMYTVHEIVNGVVKEEVMFYSYGNRVLDKQIGQGIQDNEHNYIGTVEKVFPDDVYLIKYYQEDFKNRDEAYQKDFDSYQETTNEKGETVHRCYYSTNCTKNCVEVKKFIKAQPLKSKNISYVSYAF
jgi:hypothetical protein